MKMMILIARHVCEGLIFYLSTNVEKEDPNVFGNRC
jgi:hypothetical protein